MKMESLPRTERAQNSKNEKAEKKKAAKESQESTEGAPPKKTEKKKAKAPSEPEEAEKDSKVFISPKAKSMSESERELNAADSLMDHVNSGKLSEEERNLAMKRVDDILKKYGKGRA